MLYTAETVLDMDLYHNNMGKTLYRVGDLVKTQIGWNNGESIDRYCKLIDIVDNSDISHNEYNITTGRGDKNSKVILHIKIICDMDLNPVDQKILKKDPHQVYFVNIKYELKKIHDSIKFMNNKIEFLKINRNRDDKLHDILN